jgi:hypothetical protein
MSFITQRSSSSKEERHKLEMSETNADKDHLIRAIQEDLNGILTEESADVDSQFAKTRRAMTTVLVESIQTQRLYFVVRSMLMSLIGAIIYFIVVLYFGTIDAVQAAFLGAFVFIVALIVSRLFDKQIVTVSKKITGFLNKYRKIRTFVLKRL